MRRCAARLGFVYDHTGPVGNVVVAAPSLHKIVATFIGRAAHAGIAPEAGRSAVEAAARAIARMPLGRIDPETTANIGTVAGGTATNVVAERCEVTAETRSLDERALAVQLTAMLDALTWAASECEVNLETRVDKEFTAYRLAEDDPQVRMAVDVLTSLGHAPRLVRAAAARTSTRSFATGSPRSTSATGWSTSTRPTSASRSTSLEAMYDVTLGADRRRPHRVTGPGQPLGPPIRTTPIYSGTIVNLRRSDYRRPDGTVVTREVMDHPGRRRDRARWRATTCCWCASPARPSRSTRSSCRRGSSTTRARTRSTAPAASSPRRSAARPRTGATSAASTPPRRSSRSSSTASSRPAWRRVEAAAADEDEAIEVVEWPLADLGSAIDQVRDAKTLIGLMRLERELRRTG